MTSLHYHALFDHRPDISLKATYKSLQDFYKYLTHAKRHLQNTQPVSVWQSYGILLKLDPPLGEQTDVDWHERLQRYLRSEDLEVAASLNRGSQIGDSLEVWEVYPALGILLLAEEPPESRQLAILNNRELVLVADFQVVEPSELDILPNVWIELLEPDADQSPSETTLESFFDDETRGVYQFDPQASRNSFRRRDRVRILAQNAERQVLCLERLPQTSHLRLRPNTYIIDKQIEAIQNLQDQPALAHFPLIQLFERVDHVTWSSFAPYEVSTWYVLTDITRPGTQQQREFVQRALATPDFMLLEGPPGSGKTTAIVELILQLIAQGKRILLCASTHVAVDNVIERLKDPEASYGDRALVMRIGNESNVSEAVQPYCLGRMVETEWRGLQKDLERIHPRRPSQQTLLEAMQNSQGRELTQQFLLDCAQVVCGTTIGILQHPDIKNRRAGNQPLFDVLILDEASKTTFSEFLVPGLLAKRWVVVGDRRQLSPYVEQDWLTTNVAASLPTSAKLSSDLIAQVCLDVFEQFSTRKHPPLAIATENTDLYQAYLQQGQQILGAEAVIDLNDTSAWSPGVKIMIGTPAQVDSLQPKLPSKTVIRNLLDPELTENDQSQSREWAEQVTWRLVRSYELRLLPELAQTDENRESTVEKAQPERYQEQVNALLPVASLTQYDVKEAVETVQRVALPSILESLERGFGRGRRQRSDNALAVGLPVTARQERFVRIEFQHRMHPEISQFSRQWIYQNQALHNPDDMESKRHWRYERYVSRSIWLDVRGTEQTRPTTNQQEAEVIMRELQAFANWAELFPHPETGSWRVAVLAFYKGQERLLRQQLRQWTRQLGAFRNFSVRRGGRSLLRIELCTVDRFQGHEADLVFLSLVRTKRTGFLDSPNRLNVAITRARYQLVLVGNRPFFTQPRSRAVLLRHLAQTAVTDLYYDSLLNWNNLLRQPVHKIQEVLSNRPNRELNALYAATQYYSDQESVVLCSLILLLTGRLLAAESKAHQLSQNSQIFKSLIHAIAQGWTLRHLPYESARVKSRAGMSWQNDYPFPQLATSQLPLPEAVCQLLIQELTP